MPDVPSDPARCREVRLLQRFTSNTRLIWVLVILFANLLGAIIYFAVGRNRATQTSD